MKVIATISALLLGAGMAAASDPGTTDIGTLAAPSTQTAAQKSKTHSASPSATAIKAKSVKSAAKKHKKAPIVGSASWYGKGFQGRPTASGEAYDMYQFTAASKELPLGTWVKVTNLRNGKWLIVKVNDRGPYVGDRIMDVSSSAAQMLDFKARGVERVKLEVIDPEMVATVDPWSLD